MMPTWWRRITHPHTVRAEALLALAHQGGEWVWGQTHPTREVGALLEKGVGDQ